jgi:hypothetical protein
VKLGRVYFGVCVLGNRIFDLFLDATLSIAIAWDISFSWVATINDRGIWRAEEKEWMRLKSVLTGYMKRA